MDGISSQLQIGKGAKSWDGYPGDRDARGTEEDHGVRRVTRSCQEYESTDRSAFYRLVKSGTDFRDLSSVALTLSESSQAVRRRTITELTGKHHYILPSTPSLKPIDDLMKSLLSSVSQTLSKNVCYTLTPFDARSEIVRTKETGLGNWIADVLLHAYAESLMEGKAGENGRVHFEKQQTSEHADGTQRRGGADAAILCGGTIRGDSQYGPGKITLGDILG